MRRLFMIVIVAAAAYYLYNHYGMSFLATRNPALKKQTDNVLGVANHIVASQASKSAQIVSGLLVKQASEPLMKQYDRLNPDQKDIIRKQICK